jgi:hypothetical protein
MRPKNFAFWLGSVAIAGLLGPAAAGIFAQASQPAPKTGAGAEDYECRGNSCTVAIDDAAAAKRETSAPAKPYDWKASFAEYKVGKVPRTADGKPDMQGIWSRTTLVPMERPRSQADKKEIDAETVAKLENEAQQKQVDLRTEPTDTPPGEKTTDAYNTFWRDGYWFKVPMTSLRTSQVVDPPDGRLPAMTMAARIRQNRAAELDNRRATGPEDRPLSSRCIQRPGSPGPAFGGSGPGGQESTLEIVQGTDAVIIRGEALVSQLIYLDGRPRPPENVHLQLGAARGHWEGDTLIVEYTNFSGEDGGSKQHLIARYKLLDKDHLLFGYTRDDPGTRMKPYSVEFVMWRLTDQEQLVEYACHEGNVGLQFTLSAARAKEREEAEDAAREQGK